MNESRFNHKKYLGVTPFSTRNLGFWLSGRICRGAALHLLPWWKQGYSGENVTKIRQLCLVSLMLTSGIASAANVRLQVEGYPGRWKKRACAAFYHPER